MLNVGRRRISVRTSPLGSPVSVPLVGTRNSVAGCSQRIGRIQSPRFPGYPWPGLSHGGAEQLRIDPCTIVGGTRVGSIYTVGVFGSTAGQDPRFLQGPRQSSACCPQRTRSRMVWLLLEVCLGKLKLKWTSWFRTKRQLPGRGLVLFLVRGPLMLDFLLTPKSASDSSPTKIEGIWVSPDRGCHELYVE